MAKKCNTMGHFWQKWTLTLKIVIWRLAPYRTKGARDICGHTKLQTNTKRYGGHANLYENHNVIHFTPKSEKHSQIQFLCSVAQKYGVHECRLQEMFLLLPPIWSEVFLFFKKKCWGLLKGCACRRVVLEAMLLWHREGGVGSHITWSRGTMITFNRNS